MKIKTAYGEWENCTIQKTKYACGQTAIIIWVDDEPLCKATVAIPEIDLNENHVFIKNWSENEGVLQSLIDNKVLVDTGGIVACGFCEANLCRLLPEEDWNRLFDGERL